MAPDYPTGVAAPNADPRTHHAVEAGNAEQFQVKVHLQWSATLDSNDEPLMTLTILGRAYCSPNGGDHFDPCEDGRWVKVSDMAREQFVETGTSTQNGEMGHFEVSFHSIDLKKVSSPFSSDPNKYIGNLQFRMHLKDDYKPNPLDLERACVLNDPINDCPGDPPYMTTPEEAI